MGGRVTLPTRNLTLFTQKGPGTVTGVKLMHKRVYTQTRAILRFGQAFGQTSVRTLIDRPKHCELGWSGLSPSRGLSSSPPAKLKISTEQALTCCWLMGSFLQATVSNPVDDAV